MTSLIFCASNVSAKSFTRSKGKLSDVIDSVRIGVSAGLTLLYFGGFGRFGGRNPPATLIAACTSCAATSIGRSRTNCKVIVDVPERAGGIHRRQSADLPKLPLERRSDRRDHHVCARAGIKCRHFDRWKINGRQR